MTVTPGSTCLRLSGADVLAVLHRVSTQKLDDVRVGECRTTLLCDFRGRLEHRFVVARGADGSVWLLRSDAPGHELAAAIDRSVFREDVRIEDQSALHPVVACARQSATSDPQWITESLLPRLVPESEQVELWVGASGETCPAPLTERDSIARGRARQGHEILSEFNPFEVGLARAVHLDKGCFTGQESLQRLITYSSVRRQLIAVQGIGEPPAEPSTVLSEARDVGRVTSVVATPEGWQGLAVVRGDAVEAAEQLTLVDGRVVQVLHPFERARPLGRP